MIINFLIIIQGYMAIIAGAFLNAEVIFNFGGLWNINNKKSFFLDKYSKLDAYNKYYDISHMAKEKCIWFYSALNEGDNEQKELLGSNFEQLCSVGIKSKYHGDLLFFSCYEKLLIYSYGEVVSLSSKYKGKVVSKRKIAKNFLDTSLLIEECKKEFIHRHKSMQKLQSFLNHIYTR